MAQKAQAQKEEVQEVPVILKRAHRNPKGDWGKAQKLAQELNKYADVAQGLLDDLKTVEKKMSDLSLELYETLPVKDCLYGDSPISDSKIQAYMRMYMKRIEFGRVRDVFSYQHEIPAFKQMIKEACQWALKFKDAKQ